MFIFYPEAKLIFKLRLIPSGVYSYFFCNNLWHFCRIIFNKYRRTYGFSTSSVKSALKRMLDDEIVYQSDSGYTIYDRFFGDWLASTF